MKISCTPISMARSFRENNITLEGYINFLGELELDATDLMDSLCYPWQYQNKVKEFSQVGKWLEKANLKLAAVACGNNFTKTSEDERKDNVEKVKNAIHEAAELGAPIVRIFGGYHEECGGEPGIRYSNGYRYILEGIDSCLAEAEKYNVIMAIENHGRLPGLSSEIKAIIDYFKSPYLKCTFDCANFLANNMNELEDPLKAYENLKHDVVHCHVKDWGKPFGSMAERRVAAYPAGKGGLVPLRQFIHLLECDNFSGYCSLEYEAAWQVPEVDGVKQSIEYFKDIKRMYQLFAEKM